MTHTRYTDTGILKKKKNIYLVYNYLLCKDIYMKYNAAMVENGGMAL